jgi:glycosyltransferase involved in cell wall biosynthesis
VTVLVAVPFYGKPELLPKAIASVLAQTVTDLVCCVYGDGARPPVLPDDPRLRIHVAKVNRGPYFGLQAMLEASPHDLFAPMGADDYLEPDHLARMLPLVRKTGAVITGRVFWHAPGRAIRTPSVNYEVGLFTRERLTSFGGYNPAERMGQDSLLCELIAISGPYSKTNVPTYHRVRRPNSLSTGRSTGAHSLARDRMRRRNHVVLRTCQRLKPAEMAAYRRGRVDPKTLEALSAEVEALRAVL